MRRLLLCGVCALALGCSEDIPESVENGTIDLSLSAFSSEESRVSVQVEGAGGAAGDAELVLSRAWLHSSKLVLEPCDADSAGLELDPRAYDLLGVPPAGELIDSAVATCAIELELAPNEDEDEGSPEAAALHLRGTLASGATLELSSTAKLGLEFIVSDSEELTSAPLFLGFDAAKWFDGVTLPEADDGDRLVIDGEHHADVLAEIEGKIATGAALYRDTDRDLELDEDERTAIALPR